MLADPESLAFEIAPVSSSTGVAAEAWYDPPVWARCRPFHTDLACRPIDTPILCPS